MTNPRKKPAPAPAPEPVSRDSEFVTFSVTIRSEELRNLDPKQKFLLDRVGRQLEALIGKGLEGSVTPPDEPADVIAEWQRGLRRLGRRLDTNQPDNDA